MQDYVTLYSELVKMKAGGYRVKIHTSPTTEYQEHPQGYLYRVKGDLLYIGEEKTHFSWLVPIDKVLHIEVLEGPRDRKEKEG